MDILRTVVLSPGGRPIQRVNLADPTGLTVYTERTTFNLTPPAKTQNWSRRVARLAGSVESGESTDNWTAIATWWVKPGAGGTSNTTLVNAEALLAEIDDVQGLTPVQPKLLEWRPDGAAQSAFFEIRGSGLYTPRYDWAAFAGAQMLKLDMSIPIAPAAQGLPMDIQDPFDVDSRADYTVDVGAALTYAAPAAGRFSGSLGVATTQTEQATHHSARGYAYGDCQTTVRFDVATTVPTAMNAITNLIDANNYLYAQISGGNIIVGKKDGGGFVALASVAGPTLAAATTYWLRVRREGYLVTAEAWVGANNPPGPLNAPSFTVSSTLAGADATKYGIGSSGAAGWRATNMGSDLAVSWFEALPWTYRNHLIPAIFDLGRVPGTAGARLDVQVNTGSISLNPPVNLTATTTAGSQALATGTWNYRVTAVGWTGETAPASTSVALTNGAGGTLAVLSWTGVQDALSYRVYRSTAAGGSTYGLIATVTQSTSTFSMQFTDPGTVAPGAAPPTVGTAYRFSPVWGIIGFAPRPLSFNMVRNGDFDVDVDGWFVSGSGASISRTTALVSSGSGAMQIVSGATPATAQIAIYRRFKAGSSYTLTMRVAGVAGKTVQTQLAWAGQAGSGTGGTFVVATSAALSATAFTTVTGTWTPAVDAENVYVQVVTPTASAGNYQVDEVTLYETELGAPTLPTQQNGRSAAPPFGILQSLYGKSLDAVATNCTVTSSFSPSNNLNGDNFSWAIATNGSPGSALFDFWIDPHLMATPDDFLRGHVAIEVFWRGGIPPAIANAGGDNYIVNPRITISAISDPAAGSVQERFTQEFGTLGRQPAMTPSAVNAGGWNGPRLTRVGTILLPVNPAAPVRWKLKCLHSWSGGTSTISGVAGFTFDYLLLAPALRRAMGPTGKSAGDGTYPAFQTVANSVVAQKTIKSDLRGRVAIPAAPPFYDVEDTGLSGAPLALQPPPGGTGGFDDHSLLVKLSNLVPDDPSGATFESTSWPATVHAGITPLYRLARGQ